MCEESITGKRHPLYVQLDPKGVLALITLTLLFHELHEQFHVFAIRLHCGCWGERDLMYWELCGGCEGPEDRALVQLAGPLLNYLLLWTGYYWLNHSDAVGKRSLGFALVFASLPAVRIWAAAAGGGDEAVGLRLWLHGAEGLHPYLPRMLAFFITLFICGLPLLSCYRHMANQGRIWIFAALCLIPVWIDRLIVEIFLNGLLKRTGEAGPVVLGTPVSIILWLTLLLLVLGVYFRALLKITEIHK
ncbi:MAG TPA: hypothetical protein VFR58_11395 [Flavisolibacter sp.]|nr:hypothetical protein [Flavisolibacter sp.]